MSNDGVWVLRVDVEHLGSSWGLLWTSRSVLKAFWAVKASWPVLEASCGRRIPLQHALETFKANSRCAVKLRSSCICICICFRHRAGVLVVKKKTKMLPWKLANSTENSKIDRRNFKKYFENVRKSIKNPLKLLHKSITSLWKSRPGMGLGGLWLPSPSWEAFGVAPERCLKPTWRQVGFQNRNKSMQKSIKKLMPATIDFWLALGGFWERKLR